MQAGSAGDTFSMSANGRRQSGGTSGGRGLTNIDLTMYCTGSFGTPSSWEVLIHGHDMAASSKEPAARFVFSPHSCPRENYAFTAAGCLWKLGVQSSCDI